MNRSLYLIATDLHCGKSLVSIGLAQLLARKTPRVAYFTPIVKNKEERPATRTLLAQLKNDIAYTDTYAFTLQELMAHHDTGKLDEVYAHIIERHQQLLKDFDFVLLEGLTLSENHSNFERTFDYALAKTLNVPVGYIGSDDYESAHELVSYTRTKVEELQRRELNVVGVFINKCKKDTKEVKTCLQKTLGESIAVSVYPYVAELEKATLTEIVQHLDADVLYNKDKVEGIIPSSFVIGGMQLTNFIPYIEENSLLIMPTDRSDLIMGALIANHSPNFPNVAGIVLSVNIDLDKSVAQLLSDSPQNTIPILSVKTGTFDTVAQTASIRAKIYPENTRKIRLYAQLFDEHTDAGALNTQIAQFHTSGVTPKMFQYNIVRQAKSYQKHIVLPEGNDDRVLTAASMIAEDEIARLTILGKEDEVLARVQKLNLPWNRERIHIVNPAEDPRRHTFANKIFELRKNKGIELVQAKDMILDGAYFGTMLVYAGEADGMVSGAAHTTAHTIKPALQIIKTKPGQKTVSSVFFMLLEDRVVVYGDCAIVPNPTAEELAQIAAASAHTAQSFGITPKVALLSYSSGGSGTGEDVDKVRAATELLKKAQPELLVEGPIQYDAAVDMKVAKNKMPNSPVAGQATVLIFPDLNTGNNTYKAVQRESRCIAIGPLLQGLNKPVNDLSRGALVVDIYNTIIMTAIQAGF